MPSNSIPTIYPYSDIGNFSSTLIFLALVMFILPKYVVLKSEFSSNVVVLNTSYLTPSYMSKYSPLYLSGVSPKSISNTCLSFSFNLSYIFLLFLVYCFYIQIIKSLGFLLYSIKITLHNSIDQCSICNANMFSLSRHMHMHISLIRGWCACTGASHNTLSMQCTCASVKLLDQAQ